MAARNGGQASDRTLPTAVWAMGLGSLFMDTSSELIHALLPLFMATTLGASMLTIGLIEGIAEATAAITRVFSGTLSDRLGRRRMLTLSLVGAPTSLMAFVWVDGWLAYAMLVLTGFTLLSTTPVMLALVQENAVESPSAANGLFMMISFLARSAVVVIVGMSGDLIGLKATYIIFALVGFIGLPFAFKLPADSK